jgi:hypothetical protein
MSRRAVLRRKERVGWQEAAIPKGLQRSIVLHYATRNPATQGDVLLFVLNGPIKVAADACFVVRKRREDMLNSTLRKRREGQGTRQQ